MDRIQAVLRFLSKLLVFLGIPLLVGIIHCPIFRHAPLNHGAGRPLSFRFVASVLQEQRDDAVRRDVVGCKVSHCRTIVGVRPEVLGCKISIVVEEQIKAKNLPGRNIVFRLESRETRSG